MISPPHAALADSERMAKPVGLYLSMMSEPAPGLGGLNLAFRPVDFAELHAGLSIPVFVQSLGTGAKLLLPNHDLSPFMGLEYSYVFAASKTHVIHDSPYIGVSGGLSWQFSSGVNLEAAAVFESPLPARETFQGVSPYLSLGWFF